MSRLTAARFALSTLALAALSACGDTSGVAPRPRDDKVASVTVFPSPVSMLVGDKITLSAAVAAGPDQADRRVRWASRNPLVATVDANGVVSSLTAGTTTVTATATADTTVSGQAMVTVAGFGPTVTIAAVNHNGGPADLSNVSGILDVVANIYGSSPLISHADLVLNSAGADTVVATFQPSAATPGPVTLSFNSAGLHNGPWTLKVRLSLMSGVLIVSSATAITINNP